MSKDEAVAIAGFEMPKCCIGCALYDHFTGCCAILDECIYDEEEDDSFWVEKERYCNCPLREISFEKARKGHWIMTELPSRDVHTCSECGNLAFIDEWGNEQLTDFCPHCGAEVESQESEEIK